MKVRFLRPKAYPHPDGPKRRAGDVVDFPDDKAGKALAKQWAKNGIVEPVKAPAPPPKSGKGTKAKDDAGGGKDDAKSDE